MQFNEQNFGKLANISPVGTVTNDTKCTGTRAIFMSHTARTFLLGIIDSTLFHRPFPNFIVPFISDSLSYPNARHRKCLEHFPYSDQTP